MDAKVQRFVTIEADRIQPSIQTIVSMCDARTSAIDLAAERCIHLIGYIAAELGQGIVHRVDN